MGFGWQELLIILVIVVVIFGGTKLAGLGKASGRAIREFKDEIKASEPTPNQAVATPPPAIEAAPSAPAAEASGFLVEAPPSGQADK